MGAWGRYVWACVCCVIFIVIVLVLSTLFVMLTLRFPFITSITRGDGPHIFLTPLGPIPEETSQLLAVFLAGACLTGVVKQDLHGLPWRVRFVRQMNLYDKRWCTHVINGILWGLGCATFLIGFIWALGGYHFHIAAPSFGKGVVHLCEYAVTFLIVGATEESMFRGYFHHQLNRVFGFWVASIVTSILFGAIHLPGGTPLWGAVEAGIAGFVFCMMLWRTGSMAFPIGFHAAWDWTQSALFGVNDSGHAAAGALLRVETTGPYWITGGSDGPEASALCFLLFVVITFLLLRKPKKILGY